MLINSFTHKNANFLYSANNQIHLHDVLEDRGPVILLESNTNIISCCTQRAQVQQNLSHGFQD